MRTKNFIAPAVVISLTVAESVHLPEAAAETTVPLLSSVSHTLSFFPHSHSDVPVEGQGSSFAAFSVTGAQHPEETFRVHVIPLQERFQLVGYSAFNWWNVGVPPQHMYGPVQSLNEVTDLLSRLQLTTVQIANIRRTALEGVEQEIARDGGARVCLFRRSTLESLGLSFRPTA